MRAVALVVLLLAAGLGGPKPEAKAATARTDVRAYVRLLMQTDPYADARARMVDRQIAARGVTDPRVLAAMRTVPRHRFVDQTQAASAYDDRPLPIGHGQTISQPYIVAYMTELLRLQPGAKVLEVGTGCGYQAAVLGEIAREVYTIEIVKPLADCATNVLRELGYANIQVRHGDGYGGWPDRAPFDGIVVAAAPDHVPPALVAQLAVGARLVIPVGDADQEIRVITKTASGQREERLIPVRFVPLTRDVREQD
jgi:protein-L-isoaspartate(D-aspartate) O-methyltransferase